LNAIVTIALGGVGWFATHFLANPLVSFIQIRREAHELLFYIANVYTSDDPHVERASDNLRRSAAKISALEAAMPRFLRQTLSNLGYDLKKAAGGLVAYSNILDAVGSSDVAANQDEMRCHHETRIQRHCVEKALKLPLTDPEDRIARYIERIP
jgi:hypothetical protein